MITRDFDNASPEFKTLFNYASTLIAYSTITPLVYQGAIAGSEFLAFDADKIYIALSLTPFQITAAINSVSYYNMADNIILVNYGYYVAGPTNRIEEIKNIYFSRIAVVATTGLKFIGYRLNV